MKAPRTACPAPHEQNHLKRQRYADLPAALPKIHGRSARRTAPKKGQGILSTGAQRSRLTYRKVCTSWQGCLGIASATPQLFLFAPFRQRLLPSKGTDFHAARVQSFGQGNHSGFRQALPSSYRPSGKSFWKGGARGGRTFFQKGFPLRKLFFLQISRRLPGVSQTKKSPAERGQKKTPSRCELQGGLEQSLAAAYFPT